MRLWLDINILPFVGFIKHVIKSINVVFPEPDLPLMPINSFSLIVKLIFLMTQSSELGYLYQTDLKVILGLNKWSVNFLFLLSNLYLSAHFLSSLYFFGQEINDVASNNLLWVL